MAKKDATVTLDEVKEVMLSTAKSMLEANKIPSNEIQIKIINAANELVKTVVSINHTDNEV